MNHDELPLPEYDQNADNDGIAAEPDDIDDRVDGDDRNAIEKTADRLVAPIAGGASLAGVESGPVEEDQPRDNPTPV